MPKRRPTSQQIQQQQRLGWIFGICVLLAGGWLQYRWVHKKSQALGENPYLTRTRKIPCYQCEGRRIYHEPGHPALVKPCAVCFGIGHREILTPFADREACPRCNAMGRVNMGGNAAETCDFCDGWGQVLVNSFVESPPVAERLIESPPPAHTFQLRP